MLETPDMTPPVADRRCGRSGLHLSLLGLNLSNGKVKDGALTPSRLCRAVDAGVTHFDITSALDDRFSLGEEARPLFPYAWRSRRDEVVLTARVGLGAPPRSLNGFGSRKRILSALDRVLCRTGLTHIDVLYAHRWDRATPLEETMGALASAVQQGKTLYVGLSCFAPATVRRASDLLTRLGTPAVAYQASYSLMNRWIEGGVLDVLDDHGIGCVAAAPTAHGLLSTAHAPQNPCKSRDGASNLATIAHIAASRGQSVEQLAISWTLRDPRIASVLTTTTNAEHLRANQVAALHSEFTQEELTALDACCPGPNVASLPVDRLGSGACGS